MLTDHGVALARALGVEHDADVAWATAVVSDLIRGYTRLTITPENGRMLILTGTHDRRLIVGERPLRAVTSVTLDGQPLDVGEFSTLRSGTLIRHLGWGGPDVEAVVVADVGFEKVPRDLRAVVETAAARLIPRRLAGEEAPDIPTVAAAGFTVAELSVLNRYRRRCG